MMNARRTRMTFDGTIVDATDWADLGRRILEAADEAAELRMPFATNVRGMPSLMRRTSLMETDQE